MACYFFVLTRAPTPGRNDPATSPIPLGMGTNNGDVVLRRVVRQAVGWMALLFRDQDRADALRRLRRYLEDAGRDPATFPIEARIMLPSAEPGPWLDPMPLS